MKREERNYVSRFTFHSKPHEIPKAQENDRHGGFGESGVETAVSSPHPPEKRSHILIVDDEPEIAESLADFLVKKANFLVSAARDGPTRTIRRASKPSRQSVIERKEEKPL